MIDNSGQVFDLAVRQHWESSGLTFVGILYGGIVGIVALVLGAASPTWRAVGAGLLVALGVGIFWPGRFRASAWATRYLKSVGRPPR